MERLELPKPRLGVPKPSLVVSKPRRVVPKTGLGAAKPRLGVAQGSPRENVLPGRGGCHPGSCKVSSELVNFANIVANIAATGC